MAKYFVHPTAVIDEGARIGAGSKVWHFVHVSTDSQVGIDCTLGQNVYVGNQVVIGDRVRIQNNVSVFEGVVLESEVFCGPSMVFTNVLNPRAALEKKDQFLETRVKRGASLGANCTIICGVTIGKFAFVGAGAVVTKNVPDYALMVGVPATQVGWVSEYGERLDLPVDGQGTAACSHTGLEYILSDRVLKRISEPN